MIKQVMRIGRVTATRPTPNAIVRRVAAQRRCDTDQQWEGLTPKREAASRLVGPSGCTSCVISSTTGRRAWRKRRSSAAFSSLVSFTLTMLGSPPMASTLRDCTNETCRSFRATPEMQQLSNGRFADAHEHAGEDFRLVTRTAQNNDTQRWIIRPV
jgi:hypothetical protein